MKAGFECDLKLQDTKNRFFKECDLIMPYFPPPVKRYFSIDPDAL